MNPIALQFANGNAFFFGTVVSILALLLRIRVTSHLLGSLLVLACLTGLGIAVLSAIPFSTWVYLVWLVFWMVGLVISCTRVKTQFRLIAMILPACISLVMVGSEISYRKTPSIHISAQDTICVIGDSFSAGLEKSERPWPRILSEALQLRVINLAQAGATAETALNQTGGVTETNSLVIIEIGGNDLLGLSSSRDFHAHLDKLLMTLSAKSHRLVMFELPLLPFKNSFGRTQRTLARKYEVVLIPKAYLTSVLALKDGTVDGLHLSPKGHEALANAVMGVLKIQQIP
jgi:acyl-CoA thioesterase-1